MGGVLTRSFLQEEKTPLHLAASLPHGVELVKLLLDAGADVDAKDRVRGGEGVGQSWARELRVLLLLSALRPTSCQRADLDFLMKVRTLGVFL